MNTAASGAASSSTGDDNPPGDAGPGELRDESSTVFNDLLAPLRADVHAHCYRMLGSLHDAEDATQETMLRAWRSIGTFEGRSSPRTWLIRIATNVCIDSATRSSARAVPMDLCPASPRAVPDGQPRLDIAWVQPYPDQALSGVQSSPHARYELMESVELAFITALQLLPANQRAALLLFDVLGFSAREVATIMATSPASVNSALQRARSLVASHTPDVSQQQNLRGLGDRALSELVNAYTTAVERGDSEAIIALLTKDATWSMPPLPSWYRGHESIRDFLNRMALLPSWRHQTTHANGQPAIAGYRWDPSQRTYTAYVIDVLTFRDGLIDGVTAFIDDTLFPNFNLTSTLSAESPSSST